MSTFGWTPSEHRDELQQFHDRQNREELMKDTEPTTTIEALTKDIATIDIAVDALIAKNAALVSENALLRRSLTVMNTRTDELDAENERLSDVEANAEALLTRLEHIAAVLKTFYFAELSMSSVQPILALALEFNPDIVEQRR